jgi:acetyl esterase
MPPLDENDPLRALHPLLRKKVADRLSRPSLAETGVAQARLAFLAGQAVGNPGPAIALVEDREIDAPSGPLRYRIYLPSNRPATRLIVYFHGGGFVLGNLESHDRNVRRLAASSSCAVISVEYRLAPEFPFPAAFEDAQFALRYFTSEAKSTAGSPVQVFAAGDSAGATLAVAATLGLKNNCEFSVCGLVAFYPLLDLCNVGTTASYAAYADGSAGLSLADLLWFRDHYAPDRSTHRDWRCSPLLAEDLVDLPPTLIIAAEYDILRDESIVFAERLRRARVPAVHRVVERVNHGFLGNAEDLEEISSTLAVVRNWVHDVENAVINR